MPSLLRPKIVIQFIFLFLIGSGIVTGVYLVQQIQDVREEAATQSSLYIRNDKSYIKPGESYTLLVLSDYKNFQGYSGNLDVGSNCDSSGNTCANVSLWKNFDGSTIYVNNGGITINIPSDSGPFTATNVRFRPNPNTNNYRWSNPITMGIGETTGLMDTTKYMIMPNKPILYKGVNSSFENESPTSFEMVIGFDEFANRLGGEDLRCGGPSGKVMYFIKTDPKAYWNPQTPWMNNLRSWDSQHSYSKENLLWPINYWQQKSGWYDNLITATGDVKYNLQPNSPLTKEDNFKSKTTLHKYGSNDPKLPHYYLAAKYVGNGWGLGNGRTLLVAAASPTSFCNLRVTGNETEAPWAVHADKTSLPGYSDVLRLKYYEAASGFITNPAKYGLREDWYWAKGVGLVRIDVKNFCPNDYNTWGGPYSNCKPCRDDPDCLNEYIANPQITLNRVGDYVPKPPTCTAVSKPTLSASCSNYKNNLTCSWTKVSNATEYRVQIDNNSNFSSPTLDTTSTGSSATKAAVNADVNYYCRVQVTKSNGACTAPSVWSTVATAKKACPTPIPIPTCSNPKPGITATCNSNYKNDLRCSWSSVSNATEYQGQIDNNSDFSSPLVNTVGSSTSRSIGNVTAARTYYCRSRVTKSNGSCTVNSNWGSVVTVKKACPTPIPTTTNTPTPTKKPTDTPTDKPTDTPVITSTPIPVVGDATGEGEVDIDDYKVWVNNYNTSTQGGSNNADFNGDGQVDGEDFLIWLTNYGT